jgi:hypothetical protein
MITVDTRNLVEAVREAEVYKPPDMSKGTGYLYDNLYSRLSKGEDVKLSSLDFNAFELEDLGTINSLYSDIFERNCYAANGIASALRKAVPACKAVAYV